MYMAVQESCYALKSVSFSQLDCNPPYQRGVIQGHRAFKDGGYKDILAVPPTVVLRNYKNRPNGMEFGLCDGLQRVSHFRKKYPDHKAIRCNVTTVHSLNEEIELFESCNDGVRLNPFTLFNSELLKGDEMASDIKDICSRWGFIIGGKRSRSRINGVVALRGVYSTLGRNHFSTVMKFIADTWPNDDYRTDSQLIQAVSKFIARYSPPDLEAFLERATNKLGKQCCHMYLTEAVARTIKSNKQEPMVQAFVEAYNHRGRFPKNGVLKALEYFKS